MRERWSRWWPVALGIASVALAARQSVQGAHAGEPWLSELVWGSLSGLILVLLLSFVVGWGCRWWTRDRLAAVRAACPAAVAVPCVLHGGLYADARRLGGAMHWQTRRRPSAYGVLAVDGHAAMLWYRMPAELLGFVQVQSIESVAASRSGLLRTARALVLTVRVSDAATLDLPVALVQWWGPFPRPVRPDALDELIDQIRLRLEAGRAGALPPAG